MNKKQLIVAWVILLLILFSCYGYAQSVEPNIEANFREADSKFTYKGKPIHPGLVEEFNCWISDPGEPTIISVDVAAEHGNEYFEDNVRIEKDGSVVFQKDNGEDFFIQEIK